MKLHSKIFLGLAAITVGGFGFASSASAGIGIGGVAGSAAFSMDSGGQVTQAAVAAAVGKDTAYAGAVNGAGLTTPTRLEAFAVGTGGAISLSSDSPYIQGVTIDSARDKAQTNTMTIDTFNINATTPTVVTIK